MEGKTLLLLTLSGLCFLPACFPRKYLLFHIAKTWAGAQSYCREMYTDLASVENKEDYDRLMTAVNYYYNGHRWIGLYDDINSWRWSLHRSYSKEEAEFRMWKSGSPDNFMGYENCAEMDADGLWDDSNCTDKRKFVCYNETAASPSLALVSEPKTWHEAQRYCRERHTDLASASNSAENERLREAARGQLAWIGFHRDSWKWSDGSPTSFMRWNKAWNSPVGNPNTPCVCLHRGHWFEFKCNTKFYFICQTEEAKKHVVKVKVTRSESSVNLEDAAEAVLQQFSQSLNNHGLSKDMKLTWRKQRDGRIFYLEEKEEILNITKLC